MTAEGIVEYGKCVHYTHINIFFNFTNTLIWKLFSPNVYDFLGQQSKLQMLHQHELPKSAFTFCKGNFGGVKGKEFICVMFFDGSLKFFEQDGISQNCVLPGNRTIPTSFVYVQRTDCFLILAPNWDLECYR